MTSIQKIKLNDEIIDGLCSFFKSASILIEQDKENHCLYSYLLLQATGIERLQKIVYILDYSTTNGAQPTDAQLKHTLGHGILTIHTANLESYFDPSEKSYIEVALQILTELVNVKNGYRYTNFNLHSDQTFNLQAHLCNILASNNLDYSTIDDVLKASWEMIDLILKKYIATLITLIWNRKIGNGEIVPVCLIEYVTRGWQEIKLDLEIKTILENKKVSHSADR